MTSLFDPLQLGAVKLPNRIVMAPLTRARSCCDAVPTALMAEYYVQRATAGLIISEATGISREGLGWPNAPGLWNDAQVEGWSRVTDAVHQSGGRIVAQLWHMGRLVHPSLGGGQPVSASSTTAPDFAHTYEGKKRYVQARPATREDIGRIIGDYAAAARNTIRAGFDGVQVHGANGYLVDQFLRDSANLRDDEYGGALDNRLRFMTEVLEAVGAAVGMDRVGIRSRRTSTARASRIPIPSRCSARWRNASNRSACRGSSCARRTSRLRPARSRRSLSARRCGRSIRAVSCSTATMTDRAQGAHGGGIADAISFGRPFISNPDLVSRIPARIRAQP